jgi:hypothetical protein
MGCDIHAYVEYRKADAEPREWINYGNRINPGRNYWIFGLMSDGVRASFPESKSAKGLPSDLGYASRWDALLYIDEKESKGHCTLLQATKWKGKIYERDGKPYATDHPDWHSHSWLSTAEYEEVLNTYDAMDSANYPEAEYRALLASMKELEKHGNEVRLVFWFDN